MKCSVCNSDCPDLGPGEQFCGECGHAASKHSAASVQPPPPPPPLQPEPTGPPPQSGTYQAPISRGAPSCLIFLLDQSGSMEEPIAGGSGQKKKDAVADAVNKILKELVLSCSRETGIYHYFDVGIWTYSGARDIRPLFGDLMPVSEIERHKRLETRRKKLPDGAGGIIEQDVEFPIWVSPAANGQTPMRAAFEAIVQPLDNWLHSHPNSFPPLVINLTDGAFSGESPAPVVWEIMRKRTSDGNVLVFNCHISKDERPQSIFPGAAGAAMQDYQKFLYEMSSPLPPVMTALARAKGYQLDAGARGYVYNAQQVTMIEFLDIGTRAAQDRME
jgi:hypothetical protein